MRGLCHPVPRCLLGAVQLPFWDGRLEMAVTLDRTRAIAAWNAKGATHARRSRSSTARP